VQEKAVVSSSPEDANEKCAPKPPPLPVNRPPSRNRSQSATKNATDLKLGILGTLGAFAALIILLSASNLVMALLAISSGGTLLYCIFMEIRAHGRRRRLYEMDELIRRPIESASVIGQELGEDSGWLARGAAETATIAGSSGVLSLYKIYTFAEADEHQRILQGLAQRWPGKVTWSEDDSWGWINMLFSKANDNAGTRNFTSTVAGFLGEKATIDTLSENPLLGERGLEVREFSSQTNADYDLQIVNQYDGSLATQEQLEGIAPGPELSVKSYSGVSNFIRNTQEHDVTNQVVNSELYEELEQTGRLGGLVNAWGEPVEVVDGGFSHADNLAAAEGILDDSIDAVNINNLGIPMSALAIFGYRTFRNVQRVNSGLVTKHEANADLVFDGVRLVARGSAFASGAYVGGAMGAPLGPLGMMVGGFVGGTASSIGSSFLFQKLKDWWKFSKLNEALETIGRESKRKYVDLPHPLRRILTRHIAGEIFPLVPLKNQLAQEIALASPYAAELAVYSPEKVYSAPSPMGALARRHIQQVRATSIAMRDAGSRAYVTAWKELAEEIGKCFSDSEMGEKEEKKVLLRFGSLVAACGDFGPVPGGKAKAALAVYREEIQKYPNHPNAFRDKDGNSTARKVLAQFAHKSLTLPYEGCLYLVRGKRVLMQVVIVVLTLLTILALTNAFGYRSIETKWMQNYGAPIQEIVNSMEEYVENMGVLRTDRKLDE
jgi:hypothetical protein